MTGNEYQELAMRTNDGKSSERLLRTIYRNDDLVYTDGTVMESRVDGEDFFSVGGLLNGMAGLAGETGEFCDIIKKFIFHEKELDVEHLEKELSDVMRYVAMICDAMHWSLDRVMKLNVDKLKKRYPEGFDVERANRREEGDV